MLQPRENYTGAVGFAREPASERKKWFSRFLLALLMAGLGWMVVNNVIQPPVDNPNFEQPELPGPI